MTTENNFARSIAYLALATGILLLIPLIAMQFTTEVNWTLSDFIFAGVLIFGTGTTYKFITRKSGTLIYRVAVACGLASGLFLIWVNGAVGIIGSENNDFNLLYFVVTFVGIIGLFASRLKSKGLANTMFAMAITQGLITIAAIFSGMADVPHSSVFEIIGVNGFFITWYLVAAFLFRHADETNSNQNLDSEQ